MTKEEIMIGVLLLRKRPDYSYVIVEKDGEHVSYTVKEPCSESEEEE